MGVILPLPDGVFLPGPQELNNFFNIINFRQDEGITLVLDFYGQFLVGQEMDQAELEFHSMGVGVADKDGFPHGAYLPSYSFLS
jgi:hypothetical protein